MKFHALLVFLFVALSFFISTVLVNSQSNPIGTLLTGSFTFTINQDIPTVSCAGCNTGTCVCGVQRCLQGTVDFYFYPDCSLIPYRENVFSDSSFTFNTNKTVFIKIFCNTGNASACTEISYFTTTTSTSTTTKTSSTTSTTTSVSKTTCPHECCFNDDNYFDKSCNLGYLCANNVCYVTTTTTTVPYQISFSLVASSFISIFLLIFLVYYVFGVVLGRRSARWIAKK